VTEPQRADAHAASAPFVSPAVLSPAAPALAWALEALDNALLLADAAGRVTWVNGRAEELLAAPADELVGRPLAEAVPGLPPVDAALTGRPVTWRDRRLARHDGAALWADVTVAPAPPGDAAAAGEPAHAVAVVLADATPRATAERARQRADERFAAVVEQGVDGVYVVQDERLVYANARLAHMTGYSVEELLAMSSVEQLLTPDSYAAMSRRLARRLAGEAIPGRVPPAFMRRKDGTVFEVELRGRVTEYGGRPAAVGVAVDVSERRRTEAALRRRRSSSTRCTRRCSCSTPTSASSTGTAPRASCWGGAGRRRGPRRRSTGRPRRCPRRSPSSSCGAPRRRSGGAGGGPGACPSRAATAPRGWPTSRWWRTARRTGRSWATCRWCAT
jgi:PAS domain S-box-containing protein